MECSMIFIKPTAYKSEKNENFTILPMFLIAIFFQQFLPVIR